jgi:hypothetical protein
MFGMSLQALITTAIAVSLCAGAWFVLDTYGNYRAEQVHELYEQAASKTNEDLAKVTGEDNERAIKTLAELKAAAEAAGRITSELKYTPDQAAALSRIRGAAQ